MGARCTDVARVPARVGRMCGRAGALIWTADCSTRFGARSETSSINRTAYAQPALFAIEYAFATLWRSWGIEPVAVLGHSLGEYAAACVAGLLPLRDALRLVAERGRLTEAHAEDGAMAAVFAPKDCVDAVIARAAGLVHRRP